MSHTERRVVFQYIGRCDKLIAIDPVRCKTATKCLKYTTPMALCRVSLVDSVAVDFIRLFSTTPGQVRVAVYFVVTMLVVHLIYYLCRNELYPWSILSTASQFILGSRHSKKNQCICVSAGNNSFRCVRVVRMASDMHSRVNQSKCLHSGKQCVCLRGAFVLDTHSTFVHLNVRSCVVSSYRTTSAAHNLTINYACGCKHGSQVCNYATVMTKIMSASQYIATCT